VTNHRGTEIELKYQLTSADAFTALARAVGVTPSPAVTQVNHFYDTRDGRLAAARYSIRWREEGEAHTITLKGPEAPSSGDHLTVRPEEEVRLEADEVAMLRAGSVAPLILFARHVQGGTALAAAIERCIGDAELVYVGSFENRRARLPVALTLATGTLQVEMELDQTTFPGSRIEYEVEIELDAADTASAQQAVVALLDRAGITWRTAPSKAERFFRALQGSA
jgi:uncharacterized protein YjbK